MGQEGCHGTEAKFQPEYTREAVAMLESPCVSVSQITADLGIGANVLGPPASGVGAGDEGGGGRNRRAQSHRKPAITWNGTSAPWPHPKWVTDITIRTAEQWLYLCVVLNLYSELVVGWSMGPRQDRPLVVHAVLKA